MKKDSKSEIVVEIYLYGTTDARVGAGWIATAKPGLMVGDGTPLAGRSFTEAIWNAAGALESRGVAGRCRIFDAGGRRLAVVELGRAIPIYGALVWEAAPVLTIGAGELEAAAAAQAGGR